MDGNAPRRGGSAGRALAIAAGVVTLVGVVAIASTGSVPTGTGGSGRRPSEGFVDTVFSLFLVLMVVCTIFVTVMLTFFRRYDPETGAPRRRSPVQSLVSFFISVALLALFVRVITGSSGERRFLLIAGPPGSGDAGDDEPGARYDPEFAVWPVVAVVASSPSPPARPGSPHVAGGRLRACSPRRPSRRSPTSSPLRSTTSARRATRDAP